MHACAFDELAATYDATFTETTVGRALRGIVWSRLDRVFPPASRILELGCGTGEDAVRLAGAGLRVVATDASPTMIQVARRKARQLGCDGRIEFQCLPMEEVGSLPRTERFDGVLSNFGAINCVRDLGPLVREIAGRLSPGAPLVWVVMGKHVPWEWAWFLARGRWGKAWRRWHRAGVHWRGLTIGYPTPAQMSALLRPLFSVTRIAPLGCVLPPSYAAAWLERSPRSLALLTRLEKLAQRSSALAGLSDHYIIEATHLATGTAPGAAAL